VYLFSLAPAQLPTTALTIGPAWHVVSSSTATRCPKAPSSARQEASSLAQLSPTAPTRHQAGVAQRLLRRGRPMGRRTTPSHPARPSDVLMHQAAHTWDCILRLGRFRPRPPTIRSTQRSVPSGAAARCPEVPSSARQGAPAPAQLFMTTARHRPAIRRLRCGALSSGAAAWCPEAPISACQGAPVLVHLLTAAPTGHQADMARRLIQRGRPVLQGS
jgi:hypothetical protein